MDFDWRSKIRLTQSHKILPFDCGNDDLNSYLFDESKGHLKDLMHVTYLFEKEGETIAFFSLLNDKITLQECGSNNRFKSLFVFPRKEGKRYESYPAVKIAVFAITEKYQKLGIGTALLDTIKIDFIAQNKTGCKYITIDAFKDSLEFYKKNGFEFFTETDASNTTRAMYFNLEYVAELNNS